MEEESEILLTRAVASFLSASDAGVSAEHAIIWPRVSWDGEGGRTWEQLDSKCSFIFLSSMLEPQVAQCTRREPTTFTTTAPAEMGGAVW